MAGGTSETSAAPSLGPRFEGPQTTVRAKYIEKNTQLGWGIVHLYREGEETPDLDFGERQKEEDDDGPLASDFETVCIPAVPAYMSPGNFLGFLGERWYSELIHCRLVTSSRLDMTLALLKFRDGKSAKEFRHEYNGKKFTAIEPQTCHVVFVKDITFETRTRTSTREGAVASSSSAASKAWKPLPPPTPSLVELPSCPVCLERMDETNGLMTIVCAHVFHCNCLENWKWGCCPVCRFTNPLDGRDPLNPLNVPFGGPVSNLCSVCDCPDDLWICLVCGKVGCGRYKGGHAKDHWKETAHCFALEMETLYVWDYAGDTWIHRDIRSKGDGKLFDLPVGNQSQQGEDVVPRAKMEAMCLDYSHLITTQLESQRAYYEEMLKKATVKLSRASASADKAAWELSAARERLEEAQRRCETMGRETVPQLERDLERERGKASRGAELARSLGQALQEEKRLNEGLMKRIEHLDSGAGEVRRQLEALRAENEELKEMNRDLSMFISGQEKLSEMEREGKLEEGELEGGTASVPQKKTGSRRRRR